MGFTEKVSYLKGLADGIKLDEGSQEGKLFKAVIETLDELATAVSALEETTTALGTDVDDLAESISAVEDVLYSEDEEELYGIKCPSCEEEITLDEQMLENGKLKCPACGEEIELDFSCDCDDGCDCGDDHCNILHIHGQDGDDEQ